MQYDYRCEHLDMARSAHEEVRRPQVWRAVFRGSSLMPSAMCQEEEGNPNCCCLRPSRISCLRV